jgi:hypothetical protein
LPSPARLGKLRPVRQKLAGDQSFIAAETYTMHALWNKILVAVLTCTTLGLVVGNATFSVGQDAKAEKAVKKAKGRLPPYFSDIVTEKQRKEIYDIQAKYVKQREDLEAQLEALRAKELEEVEGILDSEQKEELKKAREKAAAKRKKKSDQATEDAKPAQS